jgi:adenine-specific DNA-methyltransferase
MAKNDHKLELTWYNKSKSLFYDPNKKEYLWVDKKDPRVSEPRILLERESYGDKDSENILIKGDNLLALKALLPDYGGKVKLIYIDPPFNTGAGFEHYDDGLEHSIWLTMMRDRLQLLKQFLRKDGKIFVHVDWHEMARLKVVLDEVFGLSNYMNTITMTTNDPSGFKATANKLFTTSNFILVYSKSDKGKNLNKLYVEKGYDKQYSKYLHNRDKNYTSWRWENLTDVVAKSLGFGNSKDAKKELTNELFEGKVAEFAIENARNVFRLAVIQGGARAKRLETIKKSKEVKNKVFVHPNEDLDNFYILNGDQILFYENRLVEIDGIKLPGQLVTDVWTDISWNGISNEGEINFPNAKKPEALIKRVLEMTTQNGDLVLDSFAGSGTTGAVAQKMNRKWIMIEMGGHAETHIIPRIKSVVSGKDQTGISKSVSWKGGSGFKYFELGDSLFVADDDLRLTVLNPKVYNGVLIRAVLKVEGFKLLHPDNGLHGISGRTIAHVTEQYLNQEYVEALLREVSDAADYLIVYAKTISSKIKLPENVEIRKIPDVLLRKFKV